MIQVNRAIIRTFVLVMYILILGFVLFGISSVFSYLNTGADRSKMLHTEIEKVDYYLPKVEWTSLENEGRPMDEQTLKNIEGDYLDAWYIRQVALNINKTDGVDDYYTKHARKDIADYVAYNIEHNIKIESTTLSHHVEVDFFSADGKLLVLTDRNVQEYKRIYKAKKLIDEIKEESTYHVIMLLEDGFWRIRHLQKELTGTGKYNLPADTLINDLIREIKGVNYYPQACPWNMYGDCFNEKQIAEDFKIIQSSGLNTVRLFVPYEDFGSAHVTDDRLNRLEMTLNLLSEANIKAVVTLFDFYGNYDVLDWTLNQRYIETIVTRLKHHNAILAWDIKNEPDLDFKSRGKVNVMAWLREMISHVRTLDPNHPVTIGWSSPEAGRELIDYVDFVSFHYYKSVNAFEKEYQLLKNEAGNKPVVLQEFGRSSYRGLWNPFGYSEEGQAKYYKNMQALFKTNNVQYMAWTLYDFEDIPVSVVGRLPWRKQAQKAYGFIDINGNKKPSFKYISGN